MICNFVPGFHFLLWMLWSLCYRKADLYAYRKALFSRRIFQSLFFWEKTAEADSQVAGYQWNKVCFMIQSDMTGRNKENQYLFVFAAGCSGISSLSPESVFCDITGSIHPCLLEVPSDRSSATDSNLWTTIK